MGSLLKELSLKYEEYVVANPKQISQIESAVRIISYLVPGTSVVISELLYSASNLLILLNDSILRQANNIKFKLPLPHKTICTWLTILEHVEVFLELSAESLGGEPWRWAIIVCIHIAKAALRFVLVRFFNSGVVPTPPIQPLKRAEELDNPATDVDEAKEEEDEDEEEAPPAPDTTRHVTFTLPQSGRKVRSLAATPRSRVRTWSVEGAPLKQQPKRLVKTALSDTQMLGEYLHIARPLVHLISMFVLGKDTWKPWLVASGVDLTSTYLLGDVKNFNREEAKEIRRRNTVLVCYLLRSPFYDEYTKRRLISLLRCASDNIPLMRFICKPILDYLPYWQRIYFYSWMT